MAEKEKMLRREKNPGELSEDTNYVSSAGERPHYKGSYEDELRESYDRLSTRPDFKYDLRADPLYRQYRDDYTRRGKEAMRDTVGRASALTGGYSSSYAENAGQQQYDASLRELGEIVPELYSLAYSRYQNEGDRLREDNELLQNLRDREYERYADELENYRTEADRAYDRRREELRAEQDREERDYRRRHSEAETRAKYGDFSGYAELYGDESAKQMRDYWIASNPDAAYGLGLISQERYFAMTGRYAPGQAVQPQNTRSSGRGGTYYPGRAPDGRDAALVQRELRNKGYNIAVDGAWGPRSQKAWDKAHGAGAKETEPEHLFWV
ncbi:MAG: hypothetical protein ACOX68_00480 [Candidatus Limivicinus sp.]|jgi:hypothetical protein